MDFESECSTRESVEDNEVNSGNYDVKNNGSCSVSVDDGDKLSSADGGVDVGVAVSPPVDSAKGMSGVNLGVRDSPPLTAKTLDGVTPSTTKGYGLKKWKRIRRDVVKDGSGGVDSGKILKRGLSGSTNVNPTKAAQFTTEIKQTSEGSVGSANVFKGTGFSDGLGVGGSSPDSRFAVGSAFAIGADSENSEDRSSRSSTAASAPKAKYDIPAVVGYARERNRTKNLGAKMVGSQAQRGQQGKGQIENSKKPRGEWVKVEKENSHSSIESDLRSPNFVFMQGAFSVNSNGKQTGQSMSYDGVDSEKVHVREQNRGYGKETAGEYEDLLHDDLAADSQDKEEKSVNQHLPTDQDPLINSILALQSAQEALEKEVLKFGEVGKDLKSLLDHQSDGDAAPVDFGLTKLDELSSSNQNGSENLGQSTSDSLQKQVISLRENVKLLESKLEEARDMLAAKESKIAEFESTLNVSKSPKEECGSTIDLQQEKSKEFETDLEGFFRQRIEAEVEYLAIVKTIQKMKNTAVDKTNLVQEQIALAEEQEAVISKLEESEIKATMLNKQAAELENHCEEIVETEEVLKVQRKACKVTSCFLIQLILLVLVVWLFVLQLTPQSRVFVPT